MTTRRLILTCLAVSIMGGSVSGIAAQTWTATWLGSRIWAGGGPPAFTAAQIQAAGDEGGIAVTANDPTSETYFVGFQPRAAGYPISKAWSMSGVVIDPNPTGGYYGLRYNAAWFQDGVQRDDISLVFCGGHGTVWNPVGPWARGECPGDNHFLMNGTIDIRGSLTVNGHLVQ